MVLVGSWGGSIAVIFLNRKSFFAIEELVHRPDAHRRARCFSPTSGESQARCLQAES
jgi:hypothetical protein